MEVPAKVKRAARALIRQFGDNFRLLGEYDGRDAYVFVFPPDLETGFPVVYLYDGENVEEVTGFAALGIVTSFS